MAQLPGGSFDPSQHGEWSGGAPVIPEGPKTMRIIDSKMVPTKAGTGEYLELDMEVLTPEFAGMKHVQRLNLNNPNPQAVDIAQRELGEITRAALGNGVIIHDSVELHNKPFIADFVVDPPEPAIEADPTTGAKARRARPARSRIIGYASLNGAGGAVPGAARPSNPEAAQASAPAQQPAPGPQEQPPATQPAAAPAQAEPDEKPPWA